MDVQKLQRALFYIFRHCATYRRPWVHGSWVQVPPLTKIFLCRFFRLCETFFPQIFFNVSKGSPFIFFLFCKRMDVQKLQRALFYIFRHCATYRRPWVHGSWVQVPPLTKIFLCRFFRLCETFFPQIFFNVSKGSPLHFFLFCKRMDVQKLQRALFYIFRHYATYRRPKKFEKKFGFFFQFFPHAGTVEENTWHFEVLLLFLSLGYGADLGRSRLVFSM